MYKILNTRFNVITTTNRFYANVKQRKFFPGRQVPFVKVENIEREVISNEIITNKGKFPLKVVLARKEDFSPIRDFIIDDFLKEEPALKSIREFILIQSSYQ